MQLCPPLHFFPLQEKELPDCPGIWSLPGWSLSFSNGIKGVSHPPPPLKCVVQDDRDLTILLPFILQQTLLTWPFYILVICQFCSF